MQIFSVTYLKCWIYSNQNILKTKVFHSHLHKSRISYSTCDPLFSTEKSFLVWVDLVVLETRDYE